MFVLPLVQKGSPMTSTTLINTQTTSPKPHQYPKVGKERGYVRNK